MEPERKLNPLQVFIIQPGSSELVGDRAMSRTVLTKDDWLLIARKYGRDGVDATSLAKELGVSKQRVQQVVIRLRKAGVDIPHTRIRRIHDLVEFIRQNLRKESVGGTASARDP